MRHALPLAFVLTLTACKKALPLDAPLSPDYKPHQVEGVWTDSGGAVYEFNNKGEALSVVDADGEVFPVIGTTPTSDGRVQWVYTVPSTGFVVTHVVDQLGGSEMMCTWSNSTSSDTERFTRVP